MSVMETFVNKLIKKDGVDHIRISVAGETQLGKVLAHDWRKRFYVPRVGDFLSPICFANWLVTGDEEARHNPKYRVKKNVRGYHRYVLFAKFYQLCSMRGMLQREMKELPFVSYKVHQSGVKEFDRWKEYPTVVKEMVEHIIDDERGPRTPYPFEQDTIDEINRLIAEIAGIDQDDHGDVEEAEAQEPAVEETLDEALSESVDEEAVEQEAQAIA